MSHPRTLDRRGRRRAGAGRSRATSARAGDTLFHERRLGGFRRRERRRRPLQGAAGIARRVPRRQPARAHRRAARGSRRTRSRSAASSSATTPPRSLDGEGGDCTLNGLYLADRDRLVDNHTTIDHAKPHCGSHEVYKGILGGTARADLQRQDHRPAGRAEDRRQADQPRAAPDRRRDDQHQAAARDLRRRREVHARRGDRPARRRGDLLPARPRPDRTPRRATC